MTSWCQCLLNPSLWPWPFPGPWSHLLGCLSSFVLGYRIVLRLHMCEQDSWFLLPIPKSASLSSITVHPATLSYNDCFLDTLSFLFLDHAFLVPSSPKCTCAWFFFDIQVLIINISDKPACPSVQRNPIVTLSLPFSDHLYWFWLLSWLLMFC